MRPSLLRATTRDKLFDPLIWGSSSFFCSRDDSILGWSVACARRHCVSGDPNDSAVARLCRSRMEGESLRSSGVEDHCFCRPGTPYQPRFPALEHLTSRVRPTLDFATRRRSGGWLSTRVALIKQLVRKVPEEESLCRMAVRSNKARQDRGSNLLHNRAVIDSGRARFRVPRRRRPRS